MKCGTILAPCAAVQKVRGSVISLMGWLCVATSMAHPVGVVQAAPLEVVNFPIQEGAQEPDKWSDESDSLPTSEIEDEAIHLLVGHLDRLRSKLYYNEPGIVFSNANEAVGTLLHAWQRDLGICADRRANERRMNCLRRTLKRVAQAAYDQGRIQRLVEVNLISMAKRLLILPDGKLAINVANARKLPNLTSYLRVWNRLAEKRRERDPDGQLEAKFLGTMERYFRRKLRGVGRVTIQEYVLATYSEKQLKYMGRLLTTATESFSAIKGELVLTLYDGTISRRPVEGSDLSRDALDDIDKKLHREATNPKGQMVGVPTPALADLIMASYLTGIQDGELLLALLEMKEVHEHYASFIERVGKIALGASRLVGIAFPEAYTAVNLGVVVYEALKQRKEYEKAQSDKTHLVH